MAKSPSTKPQVTPEVLRARAREAQAKAEALSYIADLDLSAEVAELEQATAAEHRVVERITKARAELPPARERVAAAEATIRARVAQAVAVPGVAAPMVAEALGIPLRLCVGTQAEAEDTGAGVPTADDAAADDPERYPVVAGDLDVAVTEPSYAEELS